jgi:CheY-like chemotaxis protein/glycine cleavage system H lipoate-binding protein
MTDARQVLIVEDEPVVLKVAGMALHANAIEYSEASDVASATELLARNPYKVVVTDLKLPGASGFEILDVVRGMTPRPQVIIITGYATIENALESFQLGSFDFIPKPFDVEELIGVVSRALRYSAVPQTDKVETANQYFLGRHSWASLEPDGVVTLGAAETITSVCGPIESIDCHGLGDPTTQGECFCRLVARDGFAHRIWAPVSGQTIAFNSELRHDFEIVRREPLAAGWLARVIPSNLEEELVNLSRPHPPGDG